MADRARVAYVLKGFPRLSETFIANEIHLVESLGLDLRLYSVKSGDAGKRHAVVDRIAAPLTVMPPTASISGASLAGWLVRHAPAYLLPHLALLATRPRRYLRTLARAVGLARRHRGPTGAPRNVFVKEFVQAGRIAHAVLRAGDVRHLHGHFCHGATTVTWFVADLAGLPFSFTAHAKDIYQAKLNPGDLLQRKIAAARFVATCTCANEVHLKRVATEVDADKVRTIYHGLDTTLFRPRPAPASTGDAPVVLAVGRFVEKKGYDTLVEAAALLRDRGVRFRCVLVGERGEDSDRIAALVAARGLGDVVTMHGPVAQEELVDWYARSTVFVLPCQVMADGDRDGIPNVLVEAMAMGIAPVSTDVSGIPELIDPERNGLLVPPRDPAALADAIARLCDDAGLRRRLGAAARRTVVERFDARMTTRALVGLFEASLAGETIVPPAADETLALQAASAGGTPR